MKKFFITISMAITLGLSACGESVDSKIQRLNEVEKQMNEIRSKDDNSDNWSVETWNEWNKLTTESNQIRRDLEKVTLTAEQDKDLDKAKFGNL